jgi:hypothetical protein
MRILHIIPAFQHPRVRGPHRHYHFLRELSGRHEMTLLTLHREPIDEGILAEMSAYVEAIHSFEVNGRSGGPAVAAVARLPLVGAEVAESWRFQCGLRRMRRTFERLVQTGGYEVVLFHGKSVFPVIAGWSGLPLVVDFCDATSMRLRSMMRYATPPKLPWLAARYWRTRAVERQLIRKTPHLAFISARDRAAVMGAASRAELLPNGVDLGYWTRSTPLSQSRRIVFTGVMDYAPNEDAALYLIDRIAPRVRQSLPDVELQIVGRHPSAALRERARRSPGVTVTGTVEDMRPFLEGAAVYAAPMRVAAGMQNKILEAMAMGVPVITTPIAAGGLRVDGTTPPVWVAEGERPFTDGVVSLLAQGTERARLAAEGRRFVETHFVWSRSAQKLERLCVAARAAHAAT